MRGRCCGLLVVLVLIGFVAPAARGQARLPDLASDLASDSVVDKPAARSSSREGFLPSTEAGFATLPARSPLRFPLSPGAPGLSLLTRAAGMIFSGRVTAIERVPASQNYPLETVAVTFHVERALRGVTPGQDLTISQWIGVWSSGQHYRIGERLLLFLYPPSRLGLTSSVAGPVGRFALDSGGGVLLSAQHLSAFQADPVLNGKSRVTLDAFARNVRLASGEE